MNYSRIAGCYHTIEKLSLGNSLQNARIGQLNRLSQLTTIHKVLIVGEGDGSFLLQFRQLFPVAEITVVEQSEAMILRASERLANAGIGTDHIQWIHRDLLDTQLQDDYYDLIVTLFFFDNFNQASLQNYFEPLLASSKRNAYWLLSDFCIPNPLLLKLRAWLWLKVLYLFFGYVASIPAKKLTDIEAHIQQDELRLIARNAYCGQMLFSSLYQRSGK